MAFGSRTGGQLMFSILGKNLSTHEVDVYQLIILTGEPITFPLDNLSSGNYDYEGVRDRAGNIIGQVRLDEQDPQGEISFTLMEDFDYSTTNFIYGNSLNRMLNLFKGEAFKDGEVIIIPIGTNGTDKGKSMLATSREMNKPYKYLLHNEGGLIKIAGSADPVTGEVSFRKNPYAEALNSVSRSFCIELRTSTGNGQVNRMLAVVAKNTLDITEGNTNTINFSGQRGCDVFEREDFWTEIYPTKAIETSKGIKEIYVKTIVKHGATEPTEGTDGDLIAILDDNGDVTIKKYNSSSYELDSTTKGKLQVGTRIKSNTLRETGEDDTTVNCFIAIGADKKAVDFSTNTSKRFYCKVYDFSRDEGKFLPYATEV